MNIEIGAYRKESAMYAYKAYEGDRIIHKGIVSGRPDWLLRGDYGIWDDAVDLFNKENGIETVFDRIDKDMKKVDGDNDNTITINGKDIDIPMENDENMFSDIGKSTGCEFRTPVDDADDKIKNFAFKKEMDISNAFSPENIKKGCLSKIKGVLDKPLKNLKSYNSVYESVKRKCNKQYRDINKLSEVEDDNLREIGIKTVKEDIDNLGENEKDALNGVICIDYIKEVSGYISQGEGCGESSGKKLINKSKILESMGIKCEKVDLSALIKILLPLLAAFIAAMILIRKLNTKESETESGMVGNVNTDNIKKTPIEKKALEKDSEFSMELIEEEPKKEEIISNDDIEDCNCSVSMCENDDETDIEDLMKLIDEERGRVIIEFDDSYKYTFNKNLVEYKVGDVIGSMGGIKVKSPVSFKVDEIGDCYIAGKYSDVSESDLDGYNNSEFDDLKDFMQKYSSCVNFIKDYMMYTRIPDLADYSASGKVGKKSSKLIEKYMDDADELLEDFNDAMKKSCKKNVVKGYCEREDMVGFKKMLDEKRDLWFTKIRNEYRNYGDGIYESKRRIEDYMILRSYINYINNRFSYDNENEYVKKLFELIYGFVGDRINLEATPRTYVLLKTAFEDDAKKAFNKKGVVWYDLIDGYVKGKDGVDSIKDLMNVDGNGTTLYKLVEECFRNTLNISNEDEDVDFDRNADYEEILNSGDESDAQTESAIEKAIKKLSVDYVLLKKIETTIDYGYLTGKFNEQEMELFNALSDSEKLTSFDGNSSEGLVQLTYQEREIAVKYRNMLVEQTRKEINLLNGLCNEVLSWFDRNKGKMDSGEIFDDFKEANVEEKGTVYLRKVLHDRYFVTIGENDYSDTGLPEETTTSCENNTLKYWLKYCAIASAVNCMMPIYWGTGLMLVSGPVKLPIVLIPFVVIKGRVMLVIGMGLCGIVPYPMILFVNTGSIKGSMIVPINLIIDLAKKGLKKLSETTVDGIMETLKINVPSLEDEDKKYKEDLENIDMRIQELNKMLVGGEDKFKIIEKEKAAE